MKLEVALTAMGRVAHPAARRGSEAILQRVPHLHDVQYALIARFAPTGRVNRSLSLRVGGPGFLIAAIPAVALLPARNS